MFEEIFILQKGESEVLLEYFCLTLESLFSLHRFLPKIM